MQRRSVIVYILLFAFTGYPSISAGQTTHFSVFDKSRDDHSGWLAWSDNDLALYQQICIKAESFLDQRDAAIEKLSSKVDWESYIRDMRQKLFYRIGQFEKTPLNTMVTGIVKKEGYTIEHIVFESHPGFYVTGSLFIPFSPQKPVPCIIYCSGHTESGYRDAVYQHVILNLVEKGFAVFAYDPAGQGERLQYPDDQAQRSVIGGPTSEHSYPGAQHLLLGESLTDYMIWDGVRAIDFLISRPEIDPSRIGITGRSGGGTQSAFIAAYDKRITAVATESYITSYRRLFESIGPQDAEQNPYIAIQKGFDHPDLLHLIAPRPLLIVSTTNDFFSIQGARESYMESRKSYQAFDASDKVNMVESVGSHESTLANREAVYAFFQAYLGNQGDSKDEDVGLLAPEELQVTSTGQVSGTYECATVFDLMQIRTDDMIRERQINTPAGVIKDPRFIEEKACELAGLEPARHISSVVYTGVAAEENYNIEKYFIQGEDFRYPIPFVLIKPNNDLLINSHGDEKRPLLLYLDPSGKDGVVNHEEAIVRYLEKGYTILAPDLLGTGELACASFQGDSYIQRYSYNILFGANLTGNSVAGMQASDLEVIFDHILTRDDIDTANTVSVVTGELCSSYLHFAILHQYFSKTILIHPLISYEDIVRTRFYRSKYIWTAVPGAIRYYDLPDLEALLSPSGLIIVNPVHADGEPAGPDQINTEYSYVREAYRQKSNEKNLELLIIDDEDVLNKVAEYF